LDVPSRPQSPYASSVSSFGSDDNDGASELQRPFPSSAFEVDETARKRSEASQIQKLMFVKFWDWPVYTIVLALGQILAANSYQITLLNGEVGQTATMLYVIASVYAATSILWWLAFRRFQSVWVLSTPFAVYGVAFLFVGCAPFARTEAARGALQKAAS